MDCASHLPVLLKTLQNKVGIYTIPVSPSNYSNLLWIKCSTIVRLNKYEVFSMIIKQCNKRKIRWRTKLQNSWTQIAVNVIEFPSHQGINWLI